MLNIGPAELLVVLVVALLVLGPTKLPDAARQVGRALGEMRRLSSGFQSEMRDAMKEPVESKPVESKPVEGKPVPAPKASPAEPEATPDAPDVRREPGTDGAAAT